MARYQYSGVTDQRKASFRRWRDAHALKEAGCWRGAMYLAGYALECRLKASLMEKFGALTLEALEATLSRQYQGGSVEVATHNLEYLFGFTGAISRMRSGDENHRAYRTCLTWKSNWRYRPDEADEEQGLFFLESVQTLLRFVDGNV